MNSELHLQSISQLNHFLVKKEIDFEEVLISCYERIQVNESEVRAWKYVIPKEKLVSSGSYGPLFGLCLGVKDIFATMDGPTSMGTDDGTWTGTKGGFDARIISKIRAAGATIIGKNKTAEFAVHEPTDTRNPRNYLLTPGTSSSGGAAAVASGHVSISISSQTAGSIARPSSYCGVIGFKPSFGELPRTGVLKTTETLDTVGIIGNSVENISSVFEIARVQGSNHPLHMNRASTRLGSVKIMHAIGPTFDTASPATRGNAISIATKLMGDIKLLDLLDETSLDFMSLRKCHSDIYAKELSYFLQDELKSNSISEGLKEFGMYGRDLPDKDYRNQLNFLMAQRRLADFELKNCVIIALSASDEAPKIGASDLTDANLLWTSLGLPQISLPILSSKSNNAIGLSIIGFRGSDSYILELAKKLYPSNINYADAKSL